MRCNIGSKTADLPGLGNNKAGQTGVLFYLFIDKPRFGILLIYNHQGDAVGSLADCCVGLVVVSETVSGVEVGGGGSVGAVVGAGGLVGGNGVFVGDSGVLVGGSGVLVGGNGVLVGGRGVFVGGMGVLVGGNGALVGGIVGAFLVWVGVGAGG